MRKAGLLPGLLFTKIVNKLIHNAINAFSLCLYSGFETLVLFQFHPNPQLFAVGEILLLLFITILFWHNLIPSFLFAYVQENADAE